VAPRLSLVVLDHPALLAAIGVAVERAQSGAVSTDDTGEFRTIGKRL
jgi:hypothetical protein